MAGYKIKANTEEIVSKAQNIKTQKGVMEGIMSEMKNKVNSLDEFFKSNAGKSYISQYSSVANNIQKSLDTIETHMNNLQRAAGKLDDTDNTATNKTGKLSGEGVF